MQENQSYLCFPHSFLDTLSPKDITFYGAMQVIFRRSEAEEVYVHADNLFYYIHGVVCPSPWAKHDINLTLQRLGLKDGVIKTSAFHLNEQFATCSKEVYEALKNRPELLFHYLHIIKARAYNIEVMGKRNVVCRVTLDYFAKAENISVGTISAYNSSLEKMKLIYIRRSKFNTAINNGEPNVYSLYEDREYADRFINNDAGIKDNSVSNRRRRISAKYNRFVKEPGVYSAEEIESLRQDVMLYNEECFEWGGDYLKRVKDISVFDLTSTGSNVTL